MMPEASPFTVDADWLQDISARPACRSSTRPGTCRRKGATRRPNMMWRIFPARSSSTRIPSSIPTRSFRILCPMPSTFARHVGSMGISADDTIVVYDGPGVVSAPRVWWMFRIMGVSRSTCSTAASTAGSLTDGRHRGPTKIAPNVFHADLDPSRIATFDDMGRITKSAKADRGRAAVRALRRRRPGAAARHARRAYARREKPSGGDAFQGRKTACACTSFRALRGCGHRPRNPL